MKKFARFFFYFMMANLSFFASRGWTDIDPFHVDQLDPDAMNSIAGDPDQNGAQAIRTDSAEGGLQISLKATSSDFSVNLQIIPTKGQALFGDGGYVDNGALGKPLYASRTREGVFSARAGMSEVHYLVEFRVN